MKKLLITVCAILILAAVVCLLPIPSIFSETMNAVKLDAQGNIIGTVQIPIQGTKSKSLLQTKLRNVKIGAFDDLGETKELPMSQFSQDPVQGYWKVSIGIGNTDFDMPTPENPSIGSITANSYLYTLAFSEDCDRWCIHISSGNVEEAFYVGSFSGSYSARDLAAYFDIPFVDG